MTQVLNIIAKNMKKRNIYAKQLAEVCLSMYTEMFIHVILFYIYTVIFSVTHYLTYGIIYRKEKT